MVIRWAAILWLLVVAPGMARAEEASWWRPSLVKAVTYQAIVVTTDQILYAAITATTPLANPGFFAANVVTGIAYFDTFENVWRRHAPEGGELAKAATYRAFDTMRVFAVSLALGTPLGQSLGVTAASAAVRTGVYILHDIAWDWFDPPAR